jgi:hypothetical protein
MVVGHLSPSHRVAAGLGVPLGVPPRLCRPFAAAQAAWRFYANPSVTLPRLAAPLAELARAEAPAACDARVLVALDFCPLHYGSHPSKADRVALAHRRDLGYELLTALAVSDRDGSPIAPLCLELRAADGVHSTRAARPLPEPSALDAVGPVMRHVAGLLAGLDKPAVFVIDREADSVGHYRAWDRAGRRFVVRADDQRKVLCGGRGLKLGDVAGGLRASGALASARDVELGGRPARQFVGEAEVVLHRPARTHRVDKATGRAVHRDVPGRPLPLRLVVSEVRDGRTGGVLARWLLLTNLPPDVPAATVALWYYWRWRIESYHKLLKGAGQQAECWQQEAAAAVARRLAVASMAAVVVWKLARDATPEAGRMRHVLVRLSGRQMGWARGQGRVAFTEPALLAGLGVLLPMLELLGTHDPTDLLELARRALPGLLRRDGG